MIDVQELPFAAALYELCNQQLWVMELLDASKVAA
jgi:hypothetical protein